MATKKRSTVLFQQAGLTLSVTGDTVTLDGAGFTIAFRDSTVADTLRLQAGMVVNDITLFAADGAFAAVFRPERSRSFFDSEFSAKAAPSDSPPMVKLSARKAKFSLPAGRKMAKKRRLSAKGRKAISDAAKKRWAAYHAAKATKKPKAETKPTQKRKYTFTPAGRKAIKRRWTAHRAAKAAALTTGVPTGATLH